MWQPLVLALLGLSIPSVHAATSVILENAKEMPSGWSVERNASSSDTITLFVALKEPGVTELKSKLSQRQNPADPHHGRHMTRDQVFNYMQPKQQTTAAVTTWLKSHGIKSFKTQGSLISFEATAKTVKELFQADLKYYSYSEGKNDKPSTPVLRTRSYSIPSPLLRYIDFIHPLTNFMPPPRPRHPPKSLPPKPKPQPHPKPWWWLPGSKPHHGSHDNPSSTTRPIGVPTIPPQLEEGGDEDEEYYEPNLPCLLTTTPSCIKQLYNLTYSPPESSPSSSSPVRFAVAGFLDQFIHSSDVSLFLSQYTGNPAVGVASVPDRFSTVLLNSATNPQSPPSLAGMEASLDVQYAIALGHPANVSYILTGGKGVKLSPEGDAIPDGDNEPYLEMLNYLLGLPDSEVPHVLSISYADDELSVPIPYARKVCDLFGALTARGTTVLVASGDGGAAGTGHTSCETGNLNGGIKKKGYVTTFPASCPYVTAVGAVDNVAPPVKGEWFSAGGFSDLFGRQAAAGWQEEAVSKFLQSLPSSSSSSTENEDRRQLFNSSGRAVPDISAVGSNFQIIVGGQMTEVLGTSASTPVVAAMVALVNDKRMRAGKPPLGWLNPLLYSGKVREVLRDVTEGESYGCKFSDGTQAKGWQAAAGWDPVTGLGTVDDFWEFLQVLS
ncbi:tripeptidyl-peptidase [Cladorrhinum samala]|uniref:tripeptidyl-peptidase II n=1 Tax=Cladorrhinum samala TaxID=585594 RepID=A0AAV9HF30_9PEZI|nr:tripeptidyl-peptidase [Cladorrhinum samala]